MTTPLLAEKPGCPKCGESRRFVTDLLTGVVTTTCDGCDRRAARAQQLAHYESGAIRHLAAKYGRSEERLRRWLGIRAPKVLRVKPPRVCRKCRAVPVAGRARWCDPCRAAKLRSVGIGRGRTLGPRHYKPKRCSCGATFQPTGPRCLYCPKCKVAA